MCAQRWVDKFLVLDAHCDSLVRRWKREDALDLADVNPIYQVDLPRLRQGGMDCLFTFVGDNDLAQSSVLVDAAYEMCRAHPDDFTLCTTRSQVRAARQGGQIAIVLTVEGLKMFAEDLRHMRNWQRLGVRMANVTHGGGGRPELQYDASFFGFISPEERENLRQQSKGLTPFGYEALAEMARLGIAVDLSHINDVAFWQVIETAGCPVCYTHGGCYALSPHSRALTDEMMAALAQKGGVMGIAFYRAFIHREDPTLDRLCDHFIHALEVMGPDHVGIGSDFDGTPLTLRLIPKDVSQLEILFEALAGRGVDEGTLGKIAGENFLRMLPDAPQEIDRE
jgi:membrane dipeptidase